ncbi:MAG: hypothetical protein GTN40_01295 [Candidatus Aenigmarchaeota archaeon]|nr:hypothetical protein [Candidatus Aenigmarchaeota archaeon]
MKKTTKKIIVYILTFLAKRMLVKHHPEIIAITGSFGKTSTKAAISLVLKKRFRVLSPQRSYNTEIGIPLAIFNEEVPYPLYSLLGWGKVILRMIKKLFSTKRYYQKLVLEVGADAPGDIKHIMSFIKPKIGVVTGIGVAHIGNFKNSDEIAKEKETLIKSLGKDGWAILNYDNKYSKEMAKKSQAKVVYFGEKTGSDFQAAGIKNTLYGLSFGVSFDPLIFKEDLESEVKKITKPVKTSIFGEHFIYSILPAIIVGMIYKMSFDEIAQVLKDLNNLKGRMNMILGIRGSLIIDDSYNANPESTIGALKSLTLLKTKGRKIVALGTMNELGDYTEKGHQQVGSEVAKVADVLITVGEEARKFLATEAHKKGLSRNRIFCFANSQDAGQFLRNFIVPNDVILAKGSQNNIRMEWLVREIMAKPEQAKNLLVRQSKEWKDKTP